MKKLLTLMLLLLSSTAAAQVYPYYPPPGKTYSSTTGKTTVRVPATGDFLGWDASFTSKPNGHWWGWNFSGSTYSSINAYPQDDTQTDGCFPWLTLTRTGTTVLHTELGAGGATCAAGESYAQMLLESSADIFFNEEFPGPADVWFFNNNNSSANNAYIRFNASADGTNYLKFASVPLTYTGAALITNGLTAAPFASFWTQASGSVMPMEFGTDGAQAFYIDATTQSLVATGATGGATGSGTWNAKAYYVNGTGPILPSLVGTSGSIGGSALIAGACSSGTVSITGAGTTMAVQATPVTYPGDGAEWEAYVSSANTVTVKVCAIVALTPTASTYNVRVIQ